MNFLGGGRNAAKDEPTVQQLDALLYDETIQVLSKFELNQMASLTYGELVCDAMYETFERVFSQPLKFTPVTIQKGLVICKHTLIYGSEKCVNSAYGLGKFINELRKFNTVLLAQQRQGARAIFHRIQGGGVDRGGPVREAAEQVAKLLSNINQLQHIRNTSADPGSLVPVGDSKVAFVTDDVRHYLLKKQMEQQQRIHIKSNLAKADGGFGGGYNASDGKNVVGAAHGIDEMLKMVKKEKKKYTDESSKSFSDYQAPSDDVAVLEELAAQQRAEREMAKAAAAANDDLLLGDHLPPNGNSMPAPSIDLLNFGDTGTGASATAPAMMSSGMSDPNAHANEQHVDFLGISTAAPAPAHDPFALISQSSAPPATASMQPAVNSDLLEVFAAQPQSIATNDHTTTYPDISIGSSSNNGMMAAMTTSTSSLPEPNNVSNAMDSMMPTSNAIMSSQNSGMMSSLGKEDPFKALDDLAASSTKRHVSNYQSSQAEHRILSSMSASNGDIPDMSNLQISMAPASAPPAMPPPPTPPPPPPASYHMQDEYISDGASGAGVAQVYGDSTANSHDVDEDNPWVMGGATGTGMGVAAAPSAPPPPPPPP
eukprot:CAMPEP_0119553216 /NCGR_PEP_ID=MMETSP1352-20130426/6004_1 /TAXON_ID=265584 /ORGANISM="Stauroneis constricta, Strain CCMP1120" /LENGTH=597 /DNA_ID=CAMNT_0007599573 /DNA_START=38 /DNA_END=1831 /DNA_ORIENTATION=+